MSAFKKVERKRGNIVPKVLENFTLNLNVVKVESLKVSLSLTDFQETKPRGISTASSSGDQAC